MVCPVTRRSRGAGRAVVSFSIEDITGRAYLEPYAPKSMRHEDAVAVHLVEQP